MSSVGKESYFTYVLSAGSYDCFHEDLQEGSTVEVEYQVSVPYDGRVTRWVYVMYGHVVVCTAYCTVVLVPIAHSKQSRDFSIETEDSHMLYILYCIYCSPNQNSHETLHCQHCNHVIDCSVQLGQETESTVAKAFGKGVTGRCMLRVVDSGVRHLCSSTA